MRVERRDGVGAVAGGVFPSQRQMRRERRVCNGCMLGRLVGDGTACLLDEVVRSQVAWLG